MRQHSAPATAPLLRLAMCLLLSAFASNALPAQVGERLELPSAKSAQTFYLADKTPLFAEVKSIDSGQATLTVFAGGGSLQRTIALSDFTPTSAFRAMESVASADDANAQLELAKFAADHGLVASARRSLSRARSISGDPKLGADIEATVAKSAANSMIDDFHELLKKGDLLAAQRKLDAATNRYPDEIDATRGQALAQELVAARADIERGERKEAADRAARDAAKEQDRLLRPLRERLQRGQEAYKRALAESKNTGTASRLLDTAIQNFGTVLEGADELTQKHADDEGLTSEIGRLRASARSQQIAALLASGSLYLVRGSMNAAMGRVNQTLLLDPNNQQALALRGRIEIAANSNNSGWGW